MKKGAKKLCAALFATAISLSSLVGCSSDKQPSKGSTSVTESDKTFQFGAFYTPYNGGGAAPWGAQPDDNTLENWQTLADSGINMGLPIYDTNFDLSCKSLKHAEDVGVKVLVWDYDSPGLYQIIKSNANRSYEEVRATVEASSAIIRARIDEFARYESFAGIHAYDEPSVEYYNAIAACQDWWYQNYPDYTFFVNLLPSYASGAQLYGENQEGWTFRKYVNNFVETVNPSVISYDFYPLIRNGFQGSVKTGWLSDLETFALASKKYRVPFLMYILSTQHWNHIEVEYYREIAWQAYSAMCYGTTGLNFFTYWGYLKPDNDTNNLGTGIVDARGEKTPCYYAVQEVMDEIKSFESLYLNFSWQGTMPVGANGSGTYKLLTEPLEKVYGVESVEATEDALVGEFKDASGNYAYMVANYALPFENASNTVTIRFEKCNKVLICKKGRKIVEELEDNTLTMQMGSSEGYFVLPIE